MIIKTKTKLIFQFISWTTFYVSKSWFSKSSKRFADNVRPFSIKISVFVLSRRSLLANTMPNSVPLSLKILWLSSKKFQLLLQTKTANKMHLTFTKCKGKLTVWWKAVTLNQWMPCDSEASLRMHVCLACLQFMGPEGRLKTNDLKGDWELTI